MASPVSEPTVADLLAECLRAAGVTRVFRADGNTFPPLRGIDVVEVGDPVLASLLADADGRLAISPATRPGVALLPGRRLRLSSSPGEEVLALPVLDVEVLPSAIAGWSLEAVHSALELDLDVDLDLDAPVPAGVEPLVLDASTVPLVRLSPTLADLSIMLVIGPGVVRDGQVDGVAEAARRTGARVVATAGALGVLPLDDPAWRGVVGLQEHDRRLSGLDEAELVIVAGIDPAEAADVLPPDIQVLEVAPGHLAFLAHTWPDPAPDARPDGTRALVDGLATLARTGVASDLVPLHPVRALADLFEVIDPDTLVLADAGPAGLWLARGLMGRAAGTVVVPGWDAPGFAAAGAIVAGLDGRAAVAIVTEPVDPVTEAMLDLAADLGVTVACAVWGGDSSWESAAEHRGRLVGARHDGGVQRIPVPVDLAVTEELVELAGAVVAWRADPLDGTAGG
ncbi:MAG TPA: hypothetical protein VIY72_07120 [Acidimicrobiales bacterium]